MSKKKRFINRELSWLEFNQRVLDEACDETIPLLERLKFLAITGSNLDEFLRVRVGGLQGLIAQQNTKADPSGMTPERQLKAVIQRAHQMMKDQYECLLNHLDPAFVGHGFRRVATDELTVRQTANLKKIFDSEIFAVLTPMSVSGVSDFPLLLNQTLNVCVRLGPDANSKSPEGDGERYAVIPFGQSTNRFLTLPSEGGYAYTLFEDVVAFFIDRFFPGEPILECIPFRITRNADFVVREDQAPDLLAGMEEVLDARKHSPCVRLEISGQASDTLREFLQECLDLNDEFVYDVPGPLDLSAFMQLTDVQGFSDLKYESWLPQPSPDVDMTTSIFDDISRNDVLLYHPYDGFEPVLRLIDEAADDPDVLAIKQVLYRTSRNSPVIAALARAAEQGKHVTAIVELKARFDEARNIGWARNLEQAGVQVIYGVKGLKTHSKICIVVRREPHGIQRYIHFGTGNYNEVTAKIYSDVSYMTANEELGADATSFFNAITGYSQPQQFHWIEQAPIGLRERLLEMIETETERKKQGQRAAITVKVNSLVDPKIIEALYEASQAGVKIRLNVRGICCLRPGVEGQSENIQVISIVDRFLEHARILYFYHGGDERVYISSADLMPRNLDRRVELLVPILDATARARLIMILDSYFLDTVKSSRLLPDGSYERVRPRGRRKTLRSQEVLYQQACDAVKQAKQSKRTTFEPHRGEREAS